MTSKKTLNATNLEALGAERLAALLMEISQGNAVLKRRLELVGTESPAELGKEIRKRLAAIARSRVPDPRPVQPLWACRSPPPRLRRSRVSDRGLWVLRDTRCLCRQAAPRTWAENRLLECGRMTFVIDVFARRIVGWRMSRSAETSFGLDALEQALRKLGRLRGKRLVRHSNRGSQDGSIRHTERAAAA